MNTVLHTLYRYHAWANADLFEKLKELDPDTYANQLATALRLVSHFYVVSKIFAGHLQGVPHGFTSDNLEVTPSLSELQEAVTSTDQWYNEFVATASEASLAECVAFIFTDGDHGCMTRQEMLLHVALHASIHRGEVSRILWQLSVTPPWDTLAVFLHHVEPGRRSGIISKSA